MWCIQRVRENERKILIVFNFFVILISLRYQIWNTSRKKNYEYRIIAFSSSTSRSWYPIPCIPFSFLAPLNNIVWSSFEHMHAPFSNQQHTRQWYVSTPFYYCYNAESNSKDLSSLFWRSSESTWSSSSCSSGAAVSFRQCTLPWKCFFLENVYTTCSFFMYACACVGTSLRKEICPLSSFGAI